MSKLTHLHARACIKRSNCNSVSPEGLEKKKQSLIKYTHLSHKIKWNNKPSPS
jgi:hypothetical protein